MGAPQSIIKGNPTLQDVHVDRPLTNVMINWINRQGSKYAFNNAFPFVNVDSKSDEYFVWDRGDIHRDEAQELAPGARARVTVSRLSTSNYNCKVFALAKKIADQIRSNADAPLQLERQAVGELNRKIFLRWEKQWVTKFFSAGLWTGSTTAADLVGGVDFTQFAAPGTGNPVSVIRTQIFHLMKLGVDPMTMTLTMGAEVFQVLVDHDEFLSRYEQTQAAIMTEQLMAAVLGIGRVVVPNSVENTAAEGATATNAFVLGKHMLLSWAPAAPSKEEPSAGYTFVWTPENGGAGPGGRVFKMRDDFAHSDHVEVHAAFDPRITAPELGVFFLNAVA